jgi:hypothetical protein
MQRGCEMYVLFSFTFIHWNRTLKIANRHSNFGIRGKSSIRDKLWDEIHPVLSEFYD